jgi:hypothetical protein
MSEQRQAGVTIVSDGESCRIGQVSVWVTDAGRYTTGCIIHKHQPGHVRPKKGYGNLPPQSMVRDDRIITAIAKRAFAGEKLIFTNDDYSEIRKGVTLTVTIDKPLF